MNAYLVYKFSYGRHLRLYGLYTSREQAALCAREQATVERHPMADYMQDADIEELWLQDKHIPRYVPKKEREENTL